MDSDSDSILVNGFIKRKSGPSPLTPLTLSHKLRTMYNHLMFQEDTEERYRALLVLQNAIHWLEMKNDHKKSTE